MLHKSLAYFRELDLRWDSARWLVLLGDASLAANEPDQARRFYTDAVRLAEQSQVRPITLDAMLGLAQVHARAGNVARSEALLNAVLDYAANTHGAKEGAQLVGQRAAEDRPKANGGNERRPFDALITEILAEAEPQSEMDL